MANGQTGVPRAAAWLGGAGLIPFFGLAAAGLLADGPLAADALAGLATYGAVILSFMGGCRWGFAAAGLGGGPDWAPLALSVLPALYGWAVLFVGGPAGLVLLAVGFASLLAADIVLTRAGGAPAWWPRLRWPLSVGAAASLVAGAFA